MLSRSTGATGQAAGRQSGAGRARLGRQARRLYLAVRGAGLDARSANALAAVARTIGESWHRVCRRYVDLALAGADLSGLSSLTIDETYYRRGHSYLTL